MDNKNLTTLERPLSKDKSKTLEENSSTQTDTDVSTIKEDENNRNLISRRQFVRNSLSLVGGLAVGTSPAFGVPAISNNLEKPDSRISGVQIGAITFSWRSMPDQSVKGLLNYIVDCGISAVELMGDPAEKFAGKPESPIDRRTIFNIRRQANQGTLTQKQQQMQLQVEDYNKRVAEWRANVSMDKFVEIKNMYNKAGVYMYAWKPRALGENNTDEEIEYAFRAARALGATACTVELPEKDVQTKRLGDIAKRMRTYVAYHNHTQATPTSWDTALKQSDYNAINLDVGHLVAAGYPVLPLIEKYHDRIESLHLKDRTTPKHGSRQIPMGEGDVPLIEMLQMIRDKEYNIIGGLELSYDIPEGSNGSAEVKKMLAYCRRALTA